MANVLNEETIAHNLGVVQQRIALAAAKAGRNASDVRLLLAAKTQTPETLRQAVGAGALLMGENKVQEGNVHCPALADLAIEWHFIGHLQTNKVKEVVAWAHCIQSIDRLELAEKLNARLASLDRTMAVLVQVNTSGEASKSGVPPQEALALIEQVAALPQLHVRGLMTIGLLEGDETQTRNCFRMLKQIQTESNQHDLPHRLEVLSMGMSHDLEWAVEEGSTLVRVGSAVFGPRIYA